MKRSVNCLLLALSLFVPGCASGGRDSWPQWGGPGRNFVVSSRAIAADWGESGPRELWKRELGPGYGTIASDSDRLFTMYRDESGRERVLALEAGTGSTIWEHEYPCPLIDEGEGEGKKRHDTRFGTPPQSTPLVLGGRVYTYGFCGMLNCLDAASGEVHWQHDLYHDFGANFNRFGYSSSPVAYGGTIILLVGGKNAAGVHNGITAFDQKTGEVRWQSTTYDTVWSSPILADLDGEDLLITYMDNQLLALCPKTGEVRWQYEPNGKFGESIMTPVWCPGQRLFCRIGGDESGAALMQFARSNGKIGAERVWFSNKIKGSLSNPVLIGDTFFGAGGRAGILYAWDVETGELLWRERGFPRASMIAAGGHLLVLDEKGVLTHAMPDREGINVRGTAQVLGEPSWTSPTLVGTTLFVRDNAHVAAYELSVN